MNDGEIIVASDAKIGRYNPATGEIEDIQPIPVPDNGELAVLSRDFLV